MKLFRLIVIVLLFASCGTQQKLKYAERLYNEKAYAQAVEVCEAIKGDNVEKSRRLALSYFKMLKMDKAAENFAKIPSESFNEEDKVIYCEVLKQTGNLGASTNLAATTHAAGMEEAINDYLNPLVKSPEAEIKVYPEAFNSRNDEMTPFFYAGNIYFMSNNREEYSIESNFKWQNKPFLQIVDTAGSAANRFAALNTTLHDGPVFLSEELGLMYFNRSIPSKGKNAPRVSLFEKKLATLNDSKATELPFCNNASSYMHPYLNPKGNLLVYSSNQPDGKGGMDIYAVKRNDDGSYDQPAAINGNINTKFDEVYPTFLTDSVLVFASNKTSGYGGLDLYVSNLTRDGIWTDPRLLDMPLNSTMDDFHLIPAPDLDGKYYLSTNRDGHDEIYSVFIPNSLAGGWEVTIKNEAMSEVLRGQSLKAQYDLTSVPSEQLTTDDAGMIAAKANGGTLTIIADGYKQAQINYAGGKHAYFRTISQTLSLSPNTTYELAGSVVEETSKEPISNVLVKFIAGDIRDSVYTNRSGNFAQALDLKKFKDLNSINIELQKTGYAPKKINGVKLNTDGSSFDLNTAADLSLNKIGIGDDLASLLSLEPIYFESAKADITQQGANELDKVANILLNNPQFVIECGAHTDCRGSRASNATLSSKRAQSTVKYLISKGVTANQLRYRGYGEDLPINDCKCEGAIKTSCSDDQLALNRRTEFKVVKENEAVAEAVIAAEEVVVKSSPTLAPEDKINRENVTGSTTTEIAREQVEIKLLEPLRLDQFEMGTSIVYVSTEGILQNTLPSGKLYMVQVGAFREAVDVEIFNGLEPLYSEVTPKGFTRYCIGMFTVYEKAERAMLALQKRGFSDAFIVGYKEGVRVPVQTLYSE
jgi:outer membrane protein OmpA-like peptidoglycan-associated protein